MVDNGSTDGTAELLQGFAARVSFRVTVVNEPRKGLGSARNAGLAVATGEILAFTDDDCYVSPDYLKQIVEVFKDKRIGYMGGRVLLYDPSDAPQTIRTETDIHVIEPYSFIRAGELQGANMAVRKSVADAIGDFDREFGAGARFSAGEDMDFQARASANGATGIYHPGPLVWHHHGRKPGKEYEDLMNRYHYSCGAYYAKFVLNRKTRAIFLKNWYWSVRNRLRDGELLAILRELTGFSAYILHKL